MQPISDDMESPWLLPSTERVKMVSFVNLIKSFKTTNCVFLDPGDHILPFLEKKPT